MLQVRLSSTRLSPYQYYLYVDNVEETARLLKKNGFSQGEAGRISIAPKIGQFKDEILRVYLDCLAAGGRSTLDAIAIDLRYGDRLRVRGALPLEQVAKVEDDLRVEA